MIHHATRIVRRAFVVGIAVTMAAAILPSGLAVAATAPAAPTGLAGTPGNNSVALSWDANSEPDILGYNVYRDDLTAGPTVSVIAAGDIATCSSSGDEATAALVDGLSGDVITLGDNVYQSGTTTEFNTCFQPSWGRHKARIHPAAGNHEYGTAGAAGYFGYFGSAAGTPGQGYYSFNEGAWHVIVLNSGDCTKVLCSAGSPQEQWLRSDLAANTAACTLAVWHHPRFSSGAGHGNDATVQALYQALYDYNADVILNGHEHTYERFAPQTAAGVADPVRGIRQWVVGTGGASHSSFGTPLPNSEARNADTYGVLVLSLKPTGYGWRFAPEAGKTFTDTGTASCHDANGPVWDLSAPLNGSTPLASPSFVDTTAVNGSTYRYVVTAVNTSGLESKTSNEASVIPAAPSTTYASDTFTRTVSNGWGSATTGGAYTVLDTASSYAVNGTSGALTVPTAGGLRAAILSGVSARDVDVSYRFSGSKVATGSGQYVYGVIRSVSSSAEYRAKTRLASNGAVFVQASSVVNNTETPIGSEVTVPGLSNAAGAFIRMRSQVTGVNPTTIRIRAWADGTPEPTTWLYTATNSTAALQAPGGVGFRVYLSGSTTNAPTTFNFDDLKVTSIGGTTNTAPVVDTVTIAPANPTTGQTLTATVTSHDAEGDTLTTSYQWTKAGVDIAGATSSTLNLSLAGNGDRGDLIRVRVTVSDGSLTSAPVTSSPVTVADSAPAATVVLTPANPGTAVTMTATATRSDPDAGDTVTLSYVWKVNGTTRKTTAASSSLTDTFDLSLAGNGDPGDVVSVEVTPSDGTLSGTLVSASRTVVAVTNTAPVVDTVTIAPANPTTGQTLTATVTSHDAEGDTLTTSYQWTKAGVDIAGATSSTLNLSLAGNGDRGDLIRVRVTVNDGSLTSAPVTSSPVTVADSAPAATVVLTPANPGTAVTMTATATRSDPDAGDTVTLSYVWKVNGTTRKTTAASSSLTDTFDLSLAGNGDPGDVVSVEVTPSDGTLSGTLVSASQTVAAAGPTVYASDLFSRTLVNSWGSAVTGGAWSVTPTGNAADFDTTGTTGTIALTAAGVNRSANLSISVADVDLSFRVATSKPAAGGNQFIYGLARQTTAANSYRLKLRIAPNGAVFIQASSVVNNLETAMGTEVQVPGLTHSANTFIRLRTQLVGTNPTTIRIRAWADGATEPTTWQYTTTNSVAALQAAGGVGLMAYAASATTNAPVLVSFDDFAVTSIAP